MKNKISPDAIYSEGKIPTTECLEFYSIVFREAVKQYHSNSQEVKEQAIWKALHARKQNYFNFCIYETFNKKRDENCGIHI